MGLSLTVCIIKHDIGFWLGCDRLNFERNYQLFDEIKKLDKYRIPENRKFIWYGDEGTKEIDKDPWGNDLFYTFAGLFRKIEGYEFNEAEGYSWNKSILSMLKSLSEEIPVVFYWC
jgi:hypothetical protein